MALKRIPALFQHFLLTEPVCGSLSTMNRTPLIAVTLAVVYFLLAFNAYACLVPVYGVVQAAADSECAMPQEQPVRQLCDAFKSFGVQTVPPFQPVPDTHVQGLAYDLSSISILQPIVSPNRIVFGGPPLIRIDILDLTSLLRI